MRVLVLILTLAAAACAAPPTTRLDVVDVPVDARAAAALISQYRVARGLAPVTADAGLIRMAAAQARANAQAGELSHDRGGSFETRLASFGAADRARAAENLAAGADSLEGTIAQWKRSPEHDRNLLLAGATRIGIARSDAPGSRYKRFWALIVTAD